MPPVVTRLAIASPSGQIQQLFEKTKAITKKYGAFDALLILGCLFKSRETDDEVEDNALSEEERDLITGNSTPPIPTYFYQPPCRLPKEVGHLISLHEAEDTHQSDTSGSFELAPKLHYLGKAGVFTLNDISIAYCGGAWDAQQWSRAKGSESSEHTSFVTPSSVKKLLEHEAFTAQSSVQERKRPGARREPQTLAEAKALATEQEEARSKASSLAQPVDVLLLNDWPSSITRHSRAKLPHPAVESWGSHVLADVVRKSRARYVLGLTPNGPPSTTDELEPGLAEIHRNGTWWEREPFACSDKADGPTTRFISVANFSNPAKAKWFVALDLSSPKQSTGISSGGTVTPNPLLPETSKKRAPPTGSESLDSPDNFRFQRDGNKRQRGDKPPPGYSCRICGSEEHYIRECPQKQAQSDVPPEGYICKACGSSEHYIRLCPQRSQSTTRQTVAAVAPQNCWFCLSNPNSAKHLIASIGEESYLALPKGQFPASSTALIPGGGHVLLLPLAHVPTLSLLPAEDAQTVQDEMKKYRSAIKQTYAAYGASPFEWEICKLSNTRAGHMQIQIVPVATASLQGMIGGFRDAAAREGYQFVEEAAARSLVESEQGDQAEYVRVEIDGTLFAMDLRNRKFNMQFPR